MASYLTQRPSEFMGLAYEMATIALRLVDRDDIANEVVARKIIELAKTGEHDPDRLCEAVLQRWRAPLVPAVDEPGASNWRLPLRLIPCSAPLLGKPPRRFPMYSPRGMASTSPDPFLHQALP